MRSAVTHTKAVVNRILVTGLNLQIVLGLAWMCCSFTGVQWFAESTFYVKVSKSLICDEYTGILYPLLLRLTERNYLLLCLLQLAAALGAGYALTAALGVKGFGGRLFGALGLMTWPMAMQCHMAVLPNSFTFSCVQLLLACVCRAVGKERDRWRWELLGVHIFWLLAALLQPEYLYLGAAPVILFWIYDLVKYGRTAGRRVGYHFLLAAAFAGMLLSVSGLCTREGYYGKAQRSASAAVFQRVAWSGLAKYFFEWPDEVQDVVSTDSYYEAVESPQSLSEALMLELENALGVERAQEYYRELAGYVWERNYFQVCRELAWDVTCNLIPPVAVQELLAGRGYTSYCAKNYESMRQESPALTDCYMRYTAWWLVVGSILTAVAAVLSRIGGNGRGSCFIPLLCLLWAALMTLWYTMTSAGAWDYKNGLLTGALWLVWMLVTAVKGMERE